MEFAKIARQSIAIWLNSKSNVRELRKYGYVHYVSQHSNYVIMYVDKNQAEQVINELQKISFVKKIQKSPIDEIDTNFSERFLQQYGKHPVKEQPQESIDDLMHHLVKNIEQELSKDEGGASDL